MSATSSRIEFLVASNFDGSLSIFGPGKLPLGAAIANPQQIVVSGPHWVNPPSPHMSREDFDAWVSSLRADGYTISAA